MVFRDEAITDPVFLHMSFFQLRHDYLCGNYSALSQEDVEQLSALLILADIGFNAKPRSLKTWYKILNKSKPQFINRKYCKQGLKGNIENIYLSLETWNKEDAVHEFMSILSKLPYGKSIFYNAKKITGDPKHRHVIVGVNKVGVHIFGLDQHRLLLHSIEMKDIRRFGSSKTRFLLKRRDDMLEFETELAEEMCLTLKTHIRDSMERRGATADSDVSQPHNASVSNINLDSRDEAFKQREDAVKEVAILRGKLQQVREDHARFKENFLCTVAEVDKLSIKAGSLEETCSSQRHKISVLERELDDANQKLKDALEARIALEKDREQKIMELEAKTRRLEEELEQAESRAAAAESSMQRFTRKCQDAANEADAKIGSVQVALGDVW